MPSGSEVKFEIGHVLFIDRAGYSKLLINEQSNQIYGPSKDPRFEAVAEKIILAREFGATSK